MFEWKVEEMQLMRDADRKDFRGTFSCESSVSLEDKIAFVDKMQNGIVSYIRELREKIMKDREFMLKNQSGDIKTVSLLAWLRKNDYRGLVVSSYRYGTVSVLNRHITLIQSYDYDFDYFASEVFRQQLKICLREEREYFQIYCLQNMMNYSRQSIN